MLITVTVEKNGKPLGHRLVKCESRMRELDQLLRSSDNPLQFMCQVSNTILILVLTFYFLFTSYSTKSKRFGRFEQLNQSKYVLSLHLEQFWLPTLFMTRKTHYDSSGDKHKWFEEPLRSEKQETKLCISANFHTRLEITSFTKITQILFFIWTQFYSLDSYESHF